MKRIKKSLKGLSHGKFRPVFKKLYRFLSRTQLGYERIFDLIYSKPIDDQSLENITAVIKTFERPEKLKTLVASIKRLYPTLHVIVVDDSEKPVYVDG